MMNKTYLVFKHEFLHTLKRKGFIVMTLIVPLLALLAIAAGYLMPGSPEIHSAKINSVGYIDKSGIFNTETTPKYAKLVRFNQVKDAFIALAKKEISEYFVIPEDYMTSGTIGVYTLKKNLTNPFFARAAIKKFIAVNLLEGKVPTETLDLVKSPLNLKVTRLTEKGEIASEENTFGRILLACAFALLLGLALMLGANYLLQGMGEEKESRLIEVLLSSVSVRQLLIGKVLGLGTAGLIQVAVWLFTAPLLLSFAPASLQTFLQNIHISPVFYILAAVYFILGYLLFAVLSIGVGAICPNAREGQSLALLYTLVVFVPLWFLSLLLIIPDSPIWVVLTMFPITAPTQAMLRLGITPVPVWELVTSIILLGLSIVGSLFAAIKIYRSHLLMHGKKPRIKEIISNLKNT